MEQHKTIEFEGHTLHYRDEGKNLPNTLVLLHGFLQNQEIWSYYSLTLMRSMRVITIDLPGHGYSDTFGDVHTMDFMASAVKAVLDAAGVQQCVMIGHSMGGYVALAFAEQYSYYLRGLGLMNSHAMADTPEKSRCRQEACELVCENRARYIVEFIPELFDVSKRQLLAQEIKDLQDQCLETKTEGVLAALRGMAERRSRIHVLRRLEVPVLFVLGKNDPRIPLEIGVSQALEPKYSEIMLIDDVAHMAHLEEREYVKLRLINFVNTCYY